MAAEHTSSRGRRLLSAVRRGGLAGLKTTVWLLSIMIPVSFVVLLLRFTGVLDAVGEWLSPLFTAVDLPGSAALAFLSSLFINLYSAIAVMAELAFNLREVTILAIVGLIAHNFLVEIAVLSATGSRPLRMIGLRLIAALAAGFALSLLLPAALSQEAPAFGSAAAEGVAEDLAEATGAQAAAAGDPGAAAPPEFLPELAAWAVSTLLLVVRIALILVGLMIAEHVLQELGVTRWLGRRLGPLMRVFGLPRETAFLWVVSNTLGLAYGAGVLRREVAEGRLSREDGDLLNHHIAISHSLLEDTLLFVALGVSAFWVTVPRLVLAMAAVWERRLERRLRQGRRTRPTAGGR